MSSALRGNRLQAGANINVIPGQSAIRALIMAKQNRAKSLIFHFSIIALHVPQIS